MKDKEILRRLRKIGGVIERQAKGSHKKLCCPCGQHPSLLASHGNKDLPSGTLRAIERQIEACPDVPNGWLRRTDK